MKRDEPPAKRRGGRLDLDDGPEDRKRSRYTLSFGPCFRPFLFSFLEMVVAALMVRSERFLQRFGLDLDFGGSEKSRFLTPPRDCQDFSRFRKKWPKKKDQYWSKVVGKKKGAKK